MVGMGVGRRMNGRKGSRSREVASLVFGANLDTSDLLITAPVLFLF